MDESLSSLYARANTLRRKIDDGSIDDFQVMSRCSEKLMTSRTKFENVLPCTNNASSLSNDWRYSVRMKASTMLQVQNWSATLIYRGWCLDTSFLITILVIWPKNDSRQLTNERHFFSKLRFVSSIIILTSRNTTGLSYHFSIPTQYSLLNKKSPQLKPTFEQPKSPNSNYKRI